MKIMSLISEINSQIKYLVHHWHWQIFLTFENNLSLMLSFNTLKEDISLLFSVLVYIENPQPGVGGDQGKTGQTESSERDVY